MTIIQFPTAPALNASEPHDLLLETLRAATNQLSQAGKALVQCDSEPAARVEAASHLVSAGQSIVAALNAYQRGLQHASDQAAG
ncbi:hypothetical protein E8L99_19565 [Phreatobacter aquaticus]|uniref:Uncharacterized protein n=1 Tax=Phreatobacter aquaticus TaxID=2570229 RepID=A0A4D7QRB9_9HYPH|nr:hypothetical protein [Phreatobacter aquaticus]QCK87794.1 hypothetical protein E8L99_19565 [Phreatobacter aquaticus]